MLFLPAALSVLVTHATAAPDVAASPPLIEVNLGESVIRREPRPLSRVLISNPEIAELRLLEEGQFQVRGVAVGSTDRAAQSLRFGFTGHVFPG